MTSRRDPVVGGGKKNVERLTVTETRWILMETGRGKGGEKLIHSSFRRSPDSPHVSTALTPGPCAGYSPQWWCSQIAATSTCTCTRTRKAHHPHRLLVLSCAEATRPQTEGLEASLSFYLFIYLFTYLFISVWSQEFSFYSLDYNSLYELCSLLSICILPIFIIYLS